MKKKITDPALAIAAHYLTDKNIKILNVGYETKFGTIDIVAMEEDVIIFVKVYVSCNASDGFCVEDLSEMKEREIQAAMWLQDNVLSGPVRFDNINMMKVEDDIFLVRWHINCFKNREGQ